MALLQIAEPGMSTEPHRHRLAAGIDLGTTNSLVATVRNGIAVCLADEEGRTMLPSVVHYKADGSVEVGRAALAAQASDFLFQRGVLVEQIEVRPTDGVEARVHFLAQAVHLARIRPEHLRLGRRHAQDGEQKRCRQTTQHQNSPV